MQGFLGPWFGVSIFLSTFTWKNPLFPSSSASSSSSLKSSSSSTTKSSKLQTGFFYLLEHVCCFNRSSRILFFIIYNVSYLHTTQRKLVNDNKIQTNLCNLSLFVLVCLKNKFTFMIMVKCEMNQVNHYSLTQ